MKKKYVWVLLFTLGGAYLYLCGQILTVLDAQIWGIVRQRDHDMHLRNRKDEILDSLVNIHCKCEDWSTVSPSRPGNKYTQFRDQAPAANNEQCPVKQMDLSQNSSSAVAPLINMFDVYRNLHLTYPKYVWTHTGWTDIWELSYSASQWDKEPLQVHILPFSHNDPGWLHTFKYYYNTNAKNILTHALNYLYKNTNLTFVWAETVYLSMWYEELPESHQARFRELLHSGRFEIVTGGWVMTDEAVAHYPAMLDQLMEGQLWLMEQLNYTVQNGWAIDPFGHSATMAYLLQRSGLKNALIHRTHYAVKKYLGYRQQLQFKWKQTWDKPGASGIFTHMLPFLGYNIVHSCGPSIQACCQLDFHSKRCWAWGKFQDVQHITEANVKEKAWQILDQLRLKSQLFQHNILLLQHGDDFRYTGKKEWKEELDSLIKLMDYMNRQPEMKVQIRFSTLSQYFQAVHKSMQEHDYPYPSLVGDFHTYSDRDDQYWSGYFTSRPFLKARTRHLQAQLRAAEVLYTLSLAHILKGLPAADGSKHLKERYAQLVMARRTHSLLQHHDAITGTAKKKVVQDYLQMLHSAVINLQKVLETAVSSLLQKQPTPFSTVKMLEGFSGPNSLPKADVVKVKENSPQVIVVYNPLPLSRHDVLTVLVSSHHVAVYDMDGTLLPCQVNPLWTADGTISISQTQFKLAFLATLPGLSISKFTIRPAADDSRVQCPLASVVIHSLVHQHDLRSPFVLSWEGHGNVHLENSQLKVFFCSCTGLLQGIQNRTSGALQQLSMQFVTYSTGHWYNPLKDKSGAYVFIPDGPAKDYTHHRYTSIHVHGPLVSSVTTVTPLVIQCITLYNISGSLGRSIHIENKVDIREETNLELAMRVRGLEKTGPYFYTDLNGFQVYRRETMGKHGIQGNFYPMSSLAYLDNGMQRLSIHSAQSHGVASLQPGELEVMLDRCLNQDDWRGLNEGVTDNVPTLSKFTLLLETRTRTVKSIFSQDTSFPSLLSHQLSDLLNNPVILLHQITDTTLSHTQLLNTPWPCDLRMLNLRHVKKHGDMTSALLILHKLGISCDIPGDLSDCGTEMLQWRHLFADIDIADVEEMNLGGVVAHSKVTSEQITVPRMEMQTYRLNLSLSVGLDCTLWLKQQMQAQNKRL